MSLANPHNPAFWADGSKRSQDNCFTTPYGVPIDAAAMEQHATARARTARQIDKQRANGKNPSVAALLNSPKAQRKDRMKGR